LQPVHFDRIEIFLHLAQRVDEIVGGEMPEQAAPRFAPLRTFLECLVEVANAALDCAVGGPFFNFVGASLILEALQHIGAQYAPERAEREWHVQLKAAPLQRPLVHPVLLDKEQPEIFQP
jgi:hypothetical protein